MYVNKSYRSEFKDVFEGYHLEIQVVNHCNLNCSGCNHFSPLATKWFMSAEEFFENLILVKQKLPTIKGLMILGGEPTLHPQLVDLCLIARTLFPDIILSVLTNGLELKNWTSNQFKTMQDLKVGLCISQYYQQDYSWFPSLKKNYPNVLSQTSPARFVFESDLVNIEGKENGENNFFSCSKHKLPCFTIKNKKIYICPFSAHIEHFCNRFDIDIPEHPSDYLDLTQDVGLQDLHEFCYNPKNICNYCRKGNPNIWTRANYLIDDYILSNKELFLHNYSLYQTKVTNPIYKEMIEDNLHDAIDPNYSQKFEKSLMSRFKTGKIDIIIPFYKEDVDQINRCFNSLKKQTIIDQCNIYLISDCSPKEELVFDIFSCNPNLHTFFFKTDKNSGPGVARNIGIENSFADYIFFLDMDDYLYCDNALEYLLNELENKPHLDVIYSKDWEERHNNTSYFGHGRLYRKKFINEHHSRFGLLFSYEDAYFDNSNNLNGIVSEKIDFISYFYSRNMNPIVNNTLQHLILSCWSSFSSVIHNIQSHNVTFAMSVLEQYYQLNSNPYVAQKIQSISDEEFNVFIALIIYLFKILFCIFPKEVKAWFIEKMGKSPSEQYIKQSVLDNNFYLDCGFEYPSGDFMYDMKEFILNNKLFDKILTEGKESIVNRV